MTLVHDLGWVVVPLVTAIAFTFMGIEGIADEIEMPFGTDERDLPLGNFSFIHQYGKTLIESVLDRYCQDLREEITWVAFVLTF